MKAEILCLALQRLRRKVYPLRKRPSGRSTLLHDWNHQLYTFIKLQLKSEQKWKLAKLTREASDLITAYESRKDQASVVAKPGGWGIWVTNRILKQEVNYICYGKLPSPKQDKHTKVASWLTNNGTMMAIQEYMAQAGEGIFNLSLLTSEARILIV